MTPTRRPTPLETAPPQSQVPTKVVPGPDQVEAAAQLHVAAILKRVEADAALGSLSDRDWRRARERADEILRDLKG